jgi:hypothetical protein
MYKLILVTLMAITCGDAMADWVKIGSNGNITTYVAPPPNNTTDNIIKMWGLVDLKEAKKEEAGKSFLSAKALQEYDCQKTQIRKITLSFFSGNMGAGEVVHTYMDAEKWKWTPVANGTLIESMWKMACKK